jgi:hypothetical protein
MHSVERERGREGKGEVEEKRRGRRKRAAYERL